MSEWVRRNRWGLLALPVLIVLVVVGNGHRLERFWWDADLHRATTGEQGQWTAYAEDFTDAVGDSTRSLDVRLDRVDEVTQIPQDFGDPTAVPQGLTAWQVDLSWRADPDQIVWGCSLAVRGDDGQRYEFAGTVDDLTQNDPSACTLLEQPGWQPAIVKGAERTLAPGEERPAAWQTHPIVFLPPDVTPAEVLIWWEKPRYLQLSIAH